MNCQTWTNQADVTGPSNVTACPMKEQEQVLTTLKQLIASAPVGIAIFDTHMCYQHVNGPLEKKHGISAQEHIGKSLLEVVPDLYAQMAPLFCKVLATNRAIRDQIVEGVTAQSPDKKRIWREDWFPIAGSDNEVIGVGVFVEEITEQRRNERQLANLAQRLTTLVNNTPLGVIEWDTNHVITRWAGWAEKIFGWTADEAVGKAVEAVLPVHDEDRSKVDAVMAELMDPGNRFVVSHNRNYSKSGKVVACEWYNSVLHDESGEMITALSLALDVTDKLRAAEALRLSESRFDVALKNTRILVYNTDVDLRYTWIKNMPRGKPEDVIGRRDTDLLPPEQAEPLMKMKQEVLDTGIGKRGEFSVEVGGKQLVYDLTLEQLRDAAGHVCGVAGAAMEITDRKKAEEFLKEADRSKNEFMTILAHELRNPLAPMKNALELMKRARSEASLVEQARLIMERQLAQMVRLVDDLLDVGRITCNKLELKTEVVNLSALLEDAAEVCRPDCEQAGHTLEVMLPGEAVCIDVDRVRMAQVLDNLLTNACKYTRSPGRICLAAERQGTSVRIRVKDTGIGIASDMLPKVFDLFTQADRSPARTEGGLGIGLSLVKRLVELHGGTVTACSEGPGRGSEFVICLPV